MEKAILISSGKEDLNLLAGTSLLSLYETRSGSFDEWASSARAMIEEKFGKECKPACLIFSSNPVTIGHRYIMELAAKRSKALVILVLENISTVNGNGNPEKNHFALPFEQRLKMTQTIAKSIDNVLIMPSGPFLTNRDQVPKGLLADNSKIARAHADLFYTFFFEKVCKALEISCFFAGDEPRDELEEIALNVLRQKGSAYGVPVRIAERKRVDERYVCSSLVRDAMNDGDESAIRPYVPENVVDEIVTSSCR